MQDNYNQQEIENLINEIEKERKFLEAYDNGNLEVYNARRWMRFFSGRLNEIRNFLKHEKYNLIFIGRIGVGKTTLICHLLNLLQTKEEEIRNKKTTVLKEVLSTGSGRTTISEIEINFNQTDEAFIEIEPYSDEEIIQFIEAIVEFEWCSVKGKGTDRLDPPPTEVKRALYNILGLEEKSDEGNQLAELCREFTRLEDLIHEVITLADLGNRKQKKDYFFGNLANEKDLFLWVSDTFQSINIGKKRNFSLPKKIIVNFPSNYLPEVFRERINKIVDTRGVHSGENDPHTLIRKDLDIYFSKDSQSICIFVEPFPDAPSSHLARLFGFYSKEPDRAKKMVVLINHKKDEPLQLQGQNGLVESQEEGIKIREEQVKTDLLNKGLTTFPIISINPTEGYRRSKHKNGWWFPDEDEFDYPQEHNESNKNTARNQLISVIEEQREYFFKEILEIERLFERIREGESLSIEEKQFISDLKKNALDFIEQESEGINHKIHERGLISRRISDYVSGIHASSLNSTNKKKGVHTTNSGKEIDIYSQAREETSEIFELLFDKLEGRLLGLFGGSVYEESELFKGIKDFLVPQVKRTFARKQEDIRDWIYYETDRVMHSSEADAFWESVVDRWGAGKGYTSDVVNHYRSFMKRFDLPLKQKIYDFLEKDLIQLLDNFFG